MEDDDFGGLDDFDLGSGSKPNKQNKPNNFSSAGDPKTGGALDDLADLEDLMEGGEAMGTAGARDFMAEAFCMVFKDEYT